MTMQVIVLQWMHHQTLSGTVTFLRHREEESRSSMGAKRKGPAFRGAVAGFRSESPRFSDYNCYRLTKVARSTGTRGSFYDYA